MWRLDFQEALTAEVIRLFGSHVRYRVHAGKRNFGNFDVVAGGVVGQKDDIVVDSISSPSRILGKADGRGGVVPLEACDEERRQKVLRWIFRQEVEG